MIDILTEARNFILAERFSRDALVGAIDRFETAVREDERSSADVEWEKHLLQAVRNERVKVLEAIVELEREQPHPTITIVETMLSRARKLINEKEQKSVSYSLPFLDDKPIWEDPE